MAKKGRKRLRRAIFVIISLVVAAFALNWYLTYRLEKYLRSELAHIVANATDGFYDLEFSDLHVDFFSGELLIQDVTLLPDSTIFSNLQKRDSLPSVYLDLSLGSIHFKGVNLTWRIDYTKLHFELFEIKNTNANIYGFDKNENSPKDSIKSREDFGDLYLLISPYINLLTVKEMNLSNASFTYNLKSNNNSTIYSLNNINFRVHQFILDKNSSKSGKLLYSDNFEFVADQSQQLLTNNQFELTTKNIRLSTKDSIILIEGIHFRPQEILLADTFNIDDSYANAIVEKVKVDGIYFKREDALNYLNARSLRIISSDIEYYNAKDRKQDSTAVEINISDSLLNQWSLYGLISPLLRKVEVNQIVIDSARFKYTDDSKGKKDVYSMSKFRFEANGFRIDSVSDPRHRLLYSDNFIINAAGISGSIRSKNQLADIGYLYLNMAAGNFSFGEIKLKPLNINSKMDYLSGTIKQVDITGLRYNQAIEVGKLDINNPKLEYVCVSGQTNNRATKEEDHKIQKDVFSPMMKYLLVKDININNANLAYNEKQEKNVYKLNKLNFHARNFLLNENTQNNIYAFFNFLEFDISFSDFDNYLFDQQHRLQIGDASFNSNKGKLSVSGFRYTPKTKDESQKPSTSFDIDIPNIDIERLKYRRENERDIFDMESFSILNPSVRIVKWRKNINGAKGNASEAVHPKSNIPIINVERTDINHAVFDYVNSPKNDSLHFKLERFTLKDLNNLDSDKLSLGYLSSGNLDFKLNHSHNYINASTNSLIISGLKWQQKSRFSLENFDVQKPIIAINQARQTRSKQSGDSNSDFYDILGDFAEHVNLGRINIAGATIDYTQTTDTVYKRQGLNETDLFLSDLVLDTKEKTFSLKDAQFRTNNLEFPIDNGFYTVKIDKLDFAQEKSYFNLDGIRMKSTYPKTEFAYHHPKHKDWFDVSVGSVGVKDIDFPTYFSSKKLDVKFIEVNDVLLQNFKNQNIEIEHNVMPMIYEVLQKLPLKLNVDSIAVNNFGVIYEELSKGKIVPAKIFFTDMNGRFSGFTNDATVPNQYINLDADGKLMGTGYFTANWKIPVDSSYNQFILKAHLTDFDFAELNQLITPMFPARVTSGTLKDLKFTTHASSLGANVDMTLLYNDLRVELMKDKDGVLVENKFYTKVANAVLKDNNPNKPNKKPRQPSITIERDPYHSTFNYLWQILQPPVVESVGVSEGKQNFAKSVSKFWGKVKNFFSFGKKKEEKKNDEPS